jgi:GT2 family glycosyltransferase
MNCYDLAQKCIDSANRGTVVPDRFLIVDNGGSCPISGPNIEVFRPGRNIGVAASWNWFIENTKDFCIIANDDIEFWPDTTERMIQKMEEGNEFVWVYLGLNGFSCFLLKHSLVRRIGKFDESISPGYGYFEDNDYHHRMAMAGVVEAGSPDVGATHNGSSTLKRFTPQQEEDHHRRFTIAQRNYVKKWGGLPLQETIHTPYASDIVTGLYI